MIESIQKVILAKIWSNKHEHLTRSEQYCDLYQERCYKYRSTGFMVCFADMFYDSFIL